MWCRGRGRAFRSIQALSALSEPQGIFLLLPYPTTIIPEAAGQGGQADPVEPLCH